MIMIIDNTYNTFAHFNYTNIYICGGFKTFAEGLFDRLRPTNFMDYFSHPKNYIQYHKYTINVLITYKTIKKYT